MTLVIFYERPMARTPNSSKESTHARIVEVAARALRRHGYGGTGVAAVMKEAGLTHGGFYAHFPSRDALLVEAVERAGQDSAEVVRRAAETARPRGVSPFRALVESYLGEEHLAAIETGCPVAALGCDMPRQSRPVRKASSRSVQSLIGSVHSALPSASEAEVATITGTLVGSLQLARALGDSAGRKFLAGVRETLLQEYDPPNDAQH